MKFNPKANIGAGRVSDAGSGGGGGGAGRLPIPTGKMAGGGGIGLVIVIIVLVVSQVMGGDGNGGSGNSVAGDPNAYAECRTGEDANESELCARKAVALSLENFWAAQGISGFEPAPIMTFSGSVNTACGNATSAVGPFYCPGDRTIFLDPSFFDDVLAGQLRGKGGDFVEPYVLGHEYGHHVQNITGQMRNVKTQKGANSDAVKLELQADCYAGAWTRAAEGTTDESGVQIFSDIDEADIQEALDAAYTVGDDHIQKVSGGRVNADEWTHGSSAQRMEWFQRGYRGQGCDIWS
ncbi:KPN_02809 family neutral zinc metallopeptidase [Nocardioides alcanivorans]|uniref:KPN_02809 family neutral zinc metallopeptidase n=1 Tax=Nocardioides alcanivorans TaxID=2897352 RepID=UPI001F1FBD3C|nr:neutral zinc metallopeptidase [Nocardioides alcanivorans]